MDQRFRDQNNHILHRIRLTEHHKRRKSGGLATAQGLIDQEPVTLNPPFIEVALQYFFNTYIPDSNFNYLPNMFDDFSSSRCFLSAVRAVAVANMARERNDRQMMCVARHIHIKAIKDLNAALESKEEVSMNSTLVATLVLGVFEASVIGMESSQISLRGCLDSWSAHTKGTLSLLKFRGNTLLATDFGKMIYFQLANKIRGSCCPQGSRLPAEFVELDKQMAPLMQDMGPVVHFWPTIDMVIEVSARNRGKQRQQRHDHLC
jgi:Fungal specific transcription factor domain